MHEEGHVLSARERTPKLRATLWLNFALVTRWTIARNAGLARGAIGGSGVNYKDLAVEISLLGGELHKQLLEPGARVEVGNDD